MMNDEWKGVCLNSSFIPPPSSLKFNSLLRANACVKGMLDFTHFCDEVCRLNECRGRIASRHNDMERRLLGSDSAKLREHFVQGQHLVAQDVNKLVEDQQVVILASHLLDTERPSQARRLAILLRILRVPGKSVAHRVDFDAELFRRDVLAVAVTFGLHELNHAAVQPAPGSAHHQTQRAGRLALAVSSVNHQQATRLLLIILAPPFVLLLKHKEKPKSGVRIQKK